MKIVKRLNSNLGSSANRVIAVLYQTGADTARVNVGEKRRDDWNIELLALGVFLFHIRFLTSLEYSIAEQAVHAGRHAVRHPE